MQNQQAAPSTSVETTEPLDPRIAFMLRVHARNLRSESQYLANMLAYFQQVSDEIDVLTRQEHTVETAPMVQDKAIYEERLEFYKNALKDPKNHDAVAMDLAFHESFDRPVREAETLAATPKQAELSEEAASIVTPAHAVLIQRFQDAVHYERAMWHTGKIFIFTAAEKDEASRNVVSTREAICDALAGSAR